MSGSQARGVLQSGMRQIVLALLLAGCSRASDESGAKQWADQPPPKDLAIPAYLSIELKIDGAARPAITSAEIGRAHV